MVFPVVMYRYKSWTVKKAARWRIEVKKKKRIEVFELWCWRRLLRVPWTARRSNQSILKEIGPGCSLAGVMLKLKLQYFGHLMQRANSFEKTLSWERSKAREGDDRGWDSWMALPTPGVYSNSCPSHLWCHPTISSSVVPFSSCLQSFPASGSFQMSQLFT